MLVTARGRINNNENKNNGGSGLCIGARKGEAVEHLSLSRGARVASMLRVGGGGVDRLAVWDESEDGWWVDMWVGV